jgi:hypothetical protein
MKINIIIPIGFLLVLSLISSCKKKDSDPAPTAVSYNIPSTYRTFTNVDYSDASIRLNMFKSIEAYLKLATPTSGTYQIDSMVLIRMLSNSGSPFTDSTSWNSLGISLEEKINPAAIHAVERILKEYAKSSASTQPASNGISGLLTTKSVPTKQILFDTIGQSNAQLFQKSLYGSFLIYQIDNIMSTIDSYDNTTLVTGKTYTAMEHAWDEAFGYLGYNGSYTIDSLTNASFIAAHKTQYLYIANYTTQIDAGGKSNFTKTFVNAFLIGRAAIVNKDLGTRDAQRAIITLQLEKFLGACVVQEINELLANAGSKLYDPASKMSSLSESKGFILALTFCPNRQVISDAQIADLLSHYHTYMSDVTAVDATYIKNTISTIFGYTSIQDNL